MKSEILISTEKYACSVLGLDSGWPSQFEPTDQICKLCSSPLSEPMFHPGRKGKSYLLTEMNPFKEVVINVKFCKNNQCKAMHQSFPIDIGLFNISDKIMVSLSIFLEIREFFKTGHPLTNIVNAKFNTLVVRSKQANALPYNEIEYLKDIVYNGFMAFEAMTERNLESVICGICGVCPEVCLGDGNEKNCCDNSQITYTKENEEHLGMLTMEELLEKIKYRAIEKAVYTRNETEFRKNLEELPPIMPKVTANRNPVNTEHEKRSALLKSSHYTGDPARLHQLIRNDQLDIENLNELSSEKVKDICEQCAISTHQKSKTAMIGNIYSLYASITTGLSPCHNFSKLPGKTGGFYHIVCRHGCTVASKFLGLTESVRDAADLYLSMRYPPVMFINDTPCGLAKHMECRCPNISSELWGNRTGCFETPTIGVDPIQNHNIPSIVPPEYKTNAIVYVEGTEDTSPYIHPVSATEDRYILGDRFHSSSNPHKSPLCTYHDINLCNQANCVTNN